MMLALALAAPSQSAPIRLGPFVAHQTFYEASAAAAAAGLRLQFWKREGHLDEYVIFRGQSDLRGTLAACDGRIQFVSFSLDTYDDLTSAVRQRTAQWGSPRTEVKTVELVDASRSVDELTFTWPAEKFKITFNAHQADGLTGNQDFGEGLPCQ